MASTYTTRIRLEKQGDGENANSWGLRLNQNVIDLVDEAVAGYKTIDVTGATSISLTTGNGTDDEARNFGLNFVGTLTADCTVNILAVEKIYFVNNKTTGDYNVLMKPTGGTAVTVARAMIAATTGTTIDTLNSFAQDSIIGTVSINGDLNVTGTVSATNVTATNVRAVNVTASNNIKAATVTATTKIHAPAASITTVSATNVRATNVTATNIHATTKIHTPALSVTNVSVYNNLQVDNDVSVHGNIYLTGSNSSITAVGGSFDFVSSTNVTATNVRAVNVTATNIRGTTISATNVRSDSVTATNIRGATVSAGDVICDSVGADSVSATFVSATYVRSTNVSANYVQATNVSAFNVYARNVYVSGIGAEVNTGYLNAQVTANTNEPIVSVVHKDVTTSAGSRIMNLSFLDNTIASGATFISFNAFGGGGTQNGSITSDGDGTITYNTTSDARLKENIIDAPSQWETVKNINVRNYDLKLTGNTKIGFVAQELYEHAPQCVSEGGDDVNINPWSVDYGKLTPYLTKALQEAMTKIEDLEERLSNVEENN